MHRACLVLGPCLSLEQEEKKDSQSNGQNDQSCIDLLHSCTRYIPECMNRVKLCTILTVTINYFPVHTRYNRSCTWCRDIQGQTKTIQPSLHIPYLQFGQLPQSFFSWQPIHFPQLGRLAIFDLFDSLAPSSCGWLRFVPWPVGM